MFGAVRIRLITYVLGVLAIVLLAAGGAVYAVLSHQLDAAVSAELRAAAARYNVGVFNVTQAAIPAGDPAPGPMVSTAGQAPLPNPIGVQTAAGASQGVVIGTGGTVGTEGIGAALK